MSKVQTAAHVATHLAGTANLIEAASMLVRAAEANLTLEQVRVMYPQLRDFPDAEINGFTSFSGRCFAGEVRVPSLPLPKPPKAKASRLSSQF